MNLRAVTADPPPPPPLTHTHKSHQCFLLLLQLNHHGVVGTERDRQVDVTGRQTDRHTYIQVDRRTGGWTDRHAGRHADRHTDRQTQSYLGVITK